jgi:hypothetical protein
LYIANVACGGLRTPIYLAVRQGFIPQGKGEDLRKSSKKIAGMLSKIYGGQDEKRSRLHSEQGLKPPIINHSPRNALLPFSLSVLPSIIDIVLYLCPHKFHPGYIKAIAWNSKSHQVNY